jgi:uncharacterized protein (DUF2147 family)
MNKAIAVAGFLLLSSVAPAGAQSVMGVWLTEAKTAHIQLAPCPDAASGPLCGTVVKLLDPKGADGQPVAPEQAVDRRNPDPALRSRKILGMILLYGFKKGSNANSFEGGTIYSAEDGKTYNAAVSLQPNGTLHMRGSSGIFGKTQVWTRVQ